MLTQIILIIFAYLIGSVSSAIITCKLFNLPDPRTQGSNNPGATNVLRIGGKLPAIITLLGDSLKGVTPTALALVTKQTDLFIAITMLSAFIGHLYPIFFKFKGGKGVATFIGGLLVLSWISGLIFLLIWITVFLFSRISALSALIATSLINFVVYFALGIAPTIPVIIMSVLIFYRHKENIKNLLNHTED